MELVGGWGGIGSRQWADRQERHFFAHQFFFTNLAAFPAPIPTDNSAPGEAKQPWTAFAGMGRQNGRYKNDCVIRLATCLLFP